MRETLKSYYLQQLGIEQWVRRSALSPSPFFHWVIPKNGLTKVMVVLSSGELDSSQWLSGQAGVLLKNMLSSIGVSMEQTALFIAFGDLDESSIARRDEILEAQKNRLQPSAVLVLGRFLIGQSVSTNSHPRMIRSLHPLELLAHPNQKKQAYLDLARLK